MYCNKCGSQILDDAVFCAKCGYRINQSFLFTSTAKELYQLSKNMKIDKEGIFAGAEIKIIKELAENKLKYLEIAKKKLSATEYERLERKYETFSNCYNSYLVTCSISMLSHQAYGKALHTHKVNPYIAGGMGQGIAGVGAGIYAANRAANRNEAIDESRERSRANAREADRTAEDRKLQLLEITDEIEDILNNKVEMIQYRANERIRLEASEKASREKKLQNKKQRKLMK